MVSLLQVAVKMFKDSNAISPEASDEMERELKIMKSLSHDNVVKIKGVCGYIFLLLLPLLLL